MFEQVEWVVMSSASVFVQVVGCKGMGYFIHLHVNVYFLSQYKHYFVEVQSALNYKGPLTQSRNRQEVVHNSAKQYVSTKNLITCLQYKLAPNEIHIFRNEF